jgi:hypothetical protein
MHICTEKKKLDSHFANTSCLRPDKLARSSYSASALAEHSDTANRDEFASRKKDKWQNLPCTSCRWPCIPSLGAIAGVIEERHPAGVQVVLKWIHIAGPCEILVKWNRIFKIKYHYASKEVSQEEKSKTRRAREMAKRQHVYLHIFVVPFWETDTSRTLALQ